MQEVTQNILLRDYSPAAPQSYHKQSVEQIHSNRVRYEQPHRKLKIFENFNFFICFCTVCRSSKRSTRRLEILITTTSTDGKTETKKNVN